MINNRKLITGVYIRRRAYVHVCTRVPNVVDITVEKRDWSEREWKGREKNKGREKGTSKPGKRKRKRNKERKKG